MKKLMIFCAALLTAANALAIDAVKVDGNFNIKKAKGTKATVTIDWSNVTVGEIDEGAFVHPNEVVAIDEFWKQKDQEKIADGKKEDANFVKDWPTIKKEAKDILIEEWNDEFAKKGLGLTKKDSEATHKLNIVIDNMDYGNAASSFFGFGNAGGIIIIGHAELTDIATGEVVLNIKIQHVQGDGHPSDRIRFYNVMKQLVGDIEDIY